MAITVTAGQRLTASMINAFVPKYLVQTADQALTTTSTNSNTFAGVSFGVGELWVCELFVDYGNFSAAANDLQLLWGAPTGSAVQSRLFTVGPAGGSASVTNTTGGFQSRAQNASVSYGGTTSTSSRGCARNVFTVDGGASGGTITVALKVSAGTGTAYAGSLLVAHRVS